MKMFAGSIRLSLAAFTLALVLPTISAQAAPATMCAQEGSSCVLPSGQLRDAYFGANGKYAHKVVAGTFNCDVGGFSDPIKGVVKSCFVSEPNYTYLVRELDPPPGVPNAYSINKQRPAVIAYGSLQTERFYTYVITQGSCNNATFGDPSPGSPKACYTSPIFEKCADEGGTCVVNGIGLVTYGPSNGFGNSWHTQGVSGSIACNNSTFGDPTPGRTKACFIKQ